METIVSIVGGVGLFLLGMAVMTDGLKALAGTALKTVMEKAAATPLLGTFWGAVITLIVQSSAPPRATIGLVSAGLLTFHRPEPGLRRQYRHTPHRLVGGVRGPDLAHLCGFADRVRRRLLKVVGRGRLAAAGSAIAGFALILRAYRPAIRRGGPQSLHCRTCPRPPTPPGAHHAAGMATVLLVVVGALMTTVMQSSTAAIAVTSRRSMPARSPDRRWRSSSGRTSAGDFFRRRRDRRVEHRQAARRGLYRVCWWRR